MPEGRHRACNNAAGDLSNRICAAQGLYIFGDNSRGLRESSKIHAPGLFLGMSRTHRCFVGFGNSWQSCRMFGTVVAGVTGYFLVSMEVVLVNCEHHLHHLASTLLGLLGVLVEVVFNVAILAAHAERC